MNEEHFKILKKGVKTWNEWRKSNLSEKIDLHGANLSEQNLNEVNLYNANLRDCILTNSKLKNAVLIKSNLVNAQLPNADLNKANLNGAYINHSNLKDANLVDANLTLANLFETNLYNANLKNSSLVGTHLIRTMLNGCDFNNTVLWETLFVDINFSKVLNINRCVHRGPSMIDYRSLQKSEKLPIEFLQGLGLSNEFIKEYPRLFFNKYFQFYSCFISYSHKDEDFVNRLHSDLQDNGIRCWFAPKDMKWGDKIRDSIDASIKYHDKLLLIISENSIKSDWVETEVEKAFAKERQNKKTVLFPIRLDNSALSIDKGWVNDIKNMRNIGDFTNWKDYDSYKKSFNRLLRDLKQE